MASGRLGSQLSLGLKFDQLHQILNDHITLELLAFLFGERAFTLSPDELVCPFGDLGRGVESHDLFRSRMMREKPCNFSRGLCFEKHNHLLVLSKNMSILNSSHS